MRNRANRAISVAALLLFVAAIAVAQSDTAQISGFVKDPTGAVVPSASVSIRNEATSLERKATTNESGYYVVSGLPPGYYTVSVEATGFKKYIKTQNKLDPNINPTVDIALDVGQLTETVEVVASVSAVQADTATVGKLVERTQIEFAMLNGRNPLMLALLKPGVRGGSLAGFTWSMTSGGFSINGARTQDLNISHDGAPAIRTRANGTGIGALDPDTVQEIQILTANYNAEYGRSAGGQIRMVTRSGSRDFHGSLYEYFRNAELDANTWARNRANVGRNPNKFNQFGYIASGPVYIPGAWNTDKSKLFFLWSQEWIRYRREDTSIQTVPSLLMKKGDFSELLSASNTFFGRVRVVNDPTTGQPFAGNIIPTARTSPNGLGFLRAIPDPVPGFQQGTNNFIQVRPIPSNQRKDTVSLDFMPSEKQTVRFRHQNFNFTQLDAFRSGLDRAVTDWNRPNRTASLNHIWTISPTMVNEFMMSGSVDRVYIEVQREGERYARSKYGINYPYLFPERKEIYDKIPSVNISNFVMLDGGPYPSMSTGPIYVISNNVTKIRGNHTFKFGALFERSGQNDFDQINVSGVPGGTNNQNGRFVFDDTRAGAPNTGVAIGNAAMGLFTTYAEIGPRAYTPYRNQMWELFAQDGWKVTPKLRLELGVRYTIMTPYYYSLWRNMAVFDPSRYDASKAVVQDRSTGYIISGDRFNGVLIPGKSWPEAAKGRVAIADSGEYNRLFSGGTDYWGQVQKFNFQPRLGISYALNSKTAVRSGFGRFIARPGVSDNIFLGGNPPFQPMVSVATGQADSPAGGRSAAFPQFFMTSDPVFKVAQGYNWSFAVQREVGLKTTVEVGYVGRVGLFLERERDINQLPTGTLYKSENRGVNADVLRPYKGFAIIALGEMAARSEYNGLQIEVNRRFSDHLSYGFAYTYSKSFDNASGRRERPFDSYNDKSYWGPSGFDTRHIAVINAIYEVPFLRGRNDLAGKLLGGWLLTAVTQFQTGTPVSVGTSDDFAGIGRSDAVPWNMNGDPKLPKSERKFSMGTADSNFYFRTKNADGSAIFTAPAQGTWANQTKYGLPFSNVGWQNWNLAIYKDFGITETNRFQLRAELYNWPNHPNWGGADFNPRSGTFGKVTSKSSERVIQLVARYNF
jgi:hypothetical protein